ncbi:MAG: hypothetical protein NW226_21175 [Microscillaceae bacterium]|nr:hypothetical protein [Microscillaceae bacterium]
MKNYQVIIGTFLVLFTTQIKSFAQKGQNNALLRKWEMIEMHIEGSTISEEMLERQRQSSVKTVMEFRSGGVCYLYIYTQKGRILKKNKWQLSEDQGKLTIQPEEGPAQSFDIVKISSKKMTLSIKDGNDTQLFTYRSVKE